jgi:hypothetical protein
MTMPGASVVMSVLRQLSDERIPSARSCFTALFLLAKRALDGASWKLEEDALHDEGRAR